ncbi:MAG: alpha/beta hydrolase [Myxococcales bacterium]
MVLEGQYLERSVAVKSGEISLDGLYHRGRKAPPCVLAPPHPVLGGSMTVPVVAELAWAITRAGHPTLRFDYRGVGASQGTIRHQPGTERIGDIAGEVDDLRGAIDQLLASTRSQVVCAIGYSFGAPVVLAAAADASIERIALIAPPLAAWDFSALRKVEKPVFVVCAGNDRHCDCETLRGMLGKGAVMAVIPEADAGFLRSLPHLGRSVVAWLRTGPDLPDLDDHSDEPRRDQGGFREIELHDTGEPVPELDLDD